MKNIHILPTDNPTGIFKSGNNLLFSIMNKVRVNNEGFHIYITNDEEITGFENNIWVIKGERIFLWQNTMALVSNNKPRQIILTTDLDLIADGVQAIDDNFLEWFVKNPSCEEVEVNKNPFYEESDYKPYKIIIPKEEPKQEYNNLNYGGGFTEEDIKRVSTKQETLEEAAENYSKNFNYAEDSSPQIDFVEGAKWQSERMYSEEDFKLFARQYYREIKLSKSNLLWDELADKCFEQFKKK
jgi:hypothetical protein